MKDLNSVIVIGRVANEGKFGYLPSGSAKLDFSVAFTTTKKNGNEWVNESNFINLTLWGKQAENLKDYIVKGSQLVIHGHLKVDTYEKDGQKKSTLKVIPDEVQLVGGKREGGSKAPSNSQNNYNAGGFPEDNFDDEIPFA